MIKLSQCLVDESEPTFLVSERKDVLSPEKEDGKEKEQDESDFL